MDRFTKRLLVGGTGAAQAPVRGRDEELAFLDARLDALARGLGGVVCVEGAPGSGKSRLLAEGHAAAVRRGFRTFLGGADPDEHFVPLGPLLDGLQSGVEPLLDAEKLRELSTAPDQRFWLLQELQDRLEQMALDRPLLIVLDDLQWCDDLTLLAVRTLSARLSSHAILWLVAVRRGTTSPLVRGALDRLRQAGGHELRLGPLADEAVAQIAEDVLGAVPDSEVLKVALRAEGLPLLLVEMLGGLRDEDFVTVADDVARLSGQAIPARLLSTVGRRIDLLSEPARDVVQTASAVGRSVTVELLAELLGRPAAALLTAVREALDSDLLVERNGRLYFRHDLIREAVEAGLPVSVRRALRRHAADVLLAQGAPAVETATLLADSAEAGDRLAVERLRTAAAELASTASTPAAELSCRALELTPEDAPERPAIVAETILLLWQSGQAARAKALGASTLPGILRPEDEAQVRMGLARLSSQFDFMEAVRQARAGAALPGLPAPLRAQLLALLCLNLANMGDMTACAHAVTEALDAAAQAGERGAEATAIAVDSVVLFYRMDWGAAFRQADRAAALATDLGIAHSLWVPEALWKAFLLNAAGRSGEALAESEAGVRDTRRQSQAAAMLLWLMNRSRALLDAGRLADARAEAEAASAMVDELGMGNFADATLLYTLVRVAVHTNDQEAARMYAAQAERMLRDEAPLVRNVGSWMTALVADFEGRPDRAVRLLDEAAVAIPEKRPSLASPDDPADAPVFVRMALRAGAHEKAEVAVCVAERRARLNPDFTILAASAAHARGLLDNDLAQLLRAVRLYDGCPRLLPRASALEDAGRKLAATRASEAVPYLDTALALYTEAGAERDVARVRSRLRAAGVRRRTTSTGTVKGWPELTVSEVGVVRLVAQGLTNRQVAERLSLSPHTVSSHLRRAFTKLDITSRVELAHLAGARDSGE
ncbi:LuxR family transcriptional regulator [Streptomyces sp. S.PNR 29]|uniref:helix-turn-helix transcriptional regulator n=1 Tax=Streptomyces sp. S.PNR 29 TaxID=2973805 RepID=UPI0025B17321|nr:LuxR family transcriptional regulator [Streptomyces sp. S.PNR 29]MDN0196646.1 AAA family ATPase [Streptomyces sp. S.PNR 29]